MVPKVFISYSHDSADHKEWVLNFARHLLQRGIDVILDRWDLHAGQLVPAFMAQSVEMADRVLIICTPRYVEKSNGAKGGTGYEGMIIDAQIAQDLTTAKFIPIIRVTGPQALPRFLQGRLYIDFTDETKFEDSLTELVYEIHGVPIAAKPPIGPNPFTSSNDTQVLDPTRDIPIGRADRWQDDENLFRDARQSLESRQVNDYSSRQHVREALGLHEFDGNDRIRQDLRLRYLDQVLSVLEGTIGRREAIEIWLAGVDQHNQSLRHSILPTNRLSHIQEIRLLHGYLASMASQIHDFDIRNQVERWLDITRHNMESMAHH